MSYVIKLCSRNQTSPYAVTRTTITDNVLNGFSVIEKLDDSLDTGQITLRGISTSTPYDMFNWIEIFKDTTLLYSLRIGGDNVRLISKNPLKYEHTLSLVEHTKVLERFQISGKTFTQPLNITPNKTLYDFLEELINTTPFEFSTLLDAVKVCELPSSGDLYTFLTNTISPEFTFKELNLREVFKQIGDYFDAIPRLFINSSDKLELTFDFVSELKSLIGAESNFIEKNVKQNIDLYATSLESSIQNLTFDNQTEEDGTEVYPAENSWITPRSDDYIFDFTKSYFPTPKRIYKLDKVLVYVPAIVAIDDGGTIVYLYGSSAGTPALVEFDMTNRIKEFQDYKTLDAEFDTLDTYLSETKNNTIFYEDRKNNIQIGTTYGLFDTNISLEDAIDFAGYEKVIADGYKVDGQLDDISIGVTSDFSKGEVLVRIYYTPVPLETRINIGKQDLTDVSYYSVLSTNQQGRIVNFEQFTNNLNGKVNRMGNSELQLSNRETDINDLYDIGDYTDETYIITEKEVIFYKDYVYANYGLSKNFNKISSFIGINNEIRQWEIGEKNTLNRQVVYKEHIEIDVASSGNGSLSSEMFTSKGVETYLDTFETSSTLPPIDNGVYRTFSGDPSIMSISSNGGGNHLVLSWQFENNISVGSFLEDRSGQVANNFVSYTDEIGEQELFKISFFDYLDTGDTTFTDYLDSADLYPKTDLSYINEYLLTSSPFFLLEKDRREVIGGSIEFEQKSKDNDKLILGRALSYRNRLISDNPPTTIKLYVYTNGFKFNRGNTGLVPSGYSGNVTASIVASSTNYNIQITNAELTSSVDSYCLADENDNILVAVNQSGTRLNYLTFDFLNKASGIKYKY